MKWHSKSSLHYDLLWDSSTFFTSTTITLTGSDSSMYVVLNIRLRGVYVQTYKPFTAPPSGLFKMFIWLDLSRVLKAVRDLIIQRCLAHVPTFWVVTHSILSISTVSNAKIVTLYLYLLFSMCTELWQGDNEMWNTILVKFFFL